jgi:hypothetical protein
MEIGTYSVPLYVDIHGVAMEIKNSRETYQEMSRCNGR